MTEDPTPQAEIYLPTDFLARVYSQVRTELVKHGSRIITTYNSLNLAGVETSGGTFELDQAYLLNDDRVVLMAALGKGDIPQALASDTQGAPTRGDKLYIGFIKTIGLTPREITTLVLAQDKFQRFLYPASTNDTIEFRVHAHTNTPLVILTNAHISNTRAAKNLSLHVITQQAAGATFSETGVHRHAQEIVRLVDHLAPAPLEKPFFT